MIGSVSSGVSGADGDDVGVVVSSVTKVVWIFEIWSGLEAQVATGINLKFGCISTATERPCDSFIGRELRNSSCVFGAGSASPDRLFMPDTCKTFEV